MSPFENLLRLVTACLVLTSLSPVRAGLEKEILGQWQYKGKQVGADIESVAKFEEGGAYACEMKVNLFGTQTKIQFKGTWRVEEEKHVVIEVTETSSPFFLPKGKIMRKESVKIEEDVMAYQYGRSFFSEASRRWAMTTARALSSIWLPPPVVISSMRSR